MTWNFLYNFLYFLERFGSNKTSPHKCQGSTDSCPWRFFTIHWCINLFNPHQRWEMFGFSSSRSLRTRENVFVLLSLYILYICELYYSKLKSKHTSLKKYKLIKTNWVKLIYFSLVLREREEKKPQIFRTWTLCQYHGTNTDPLDQIVGLAQNWSYGERPRHVRIRKCCFCTKNQTHFCHFHLQLTLWNRSIFLDKYYG